MLKSLGFCLLSIFCHCMMAGIFVAIYLMVFPPKEVGIGFLGAAYVFFLVSTGQGLVAGISFIGLRTYPVEQSTTSFHYHPCFLVAFCVALLIGLAASNWLSFRIQGNISSIPTEYFVISICHCVMVGLSSSLVLAFWLSTHPDFTQSASE